MHIFLNFFRFSCSQSYVFIINFLHTSHLVYNGLPKKTTCNNTIDHTLSKKETKEENTAKTIKRFNTNENCTSIIYRYNR